jgi:hypothetical protein
MSEGRSFILATSRPDAIAWCRRVGIKPYAKSTIILTTALACRGHEYREGDKAYNLGWSQELAEAWQPVVAAWKWGNPWPGSDDPWDSDDWGERS